MLKLLALFLLTVTLFGCGTTPTPSVDRHKPISCMLICEEPEKLPNKGVVSDTDLLANHTEAMGGYAKCAKDHKCLVDWINSGEK